MENLLSHFISTPMASWEDDLAVASIVLLALEGEVFYSRFLPLPTF